MSIAVAVQWAALALSTFFALLRLPGAVRGQNRGMFAAMVLIAMCMALSLPEFYLTVDGWLGGHNLANLVLRLALFAVFVILGVKAAAAFGAYRTRKLIAGPVGLAILLLAVGLTVYFFLSSSLPESSVGLQAYETQKSVQAYGSVGRMYPGYVAACLSIPGLLAAGNPRLKPLHRTGSALFGTGLLLVVIFSVLEEVVYLGPFTMLVPFTAIILVTSGLSIMWFSRVLQRRRPSQNLLAGVTET